MLRYKDLTHKQKLEIVDLIQVGITDSSLSKKFNIDRSTANRWKHKIKKEFSSTENYNKDASKFFVKGKSTLYDENGDVKLEWIKIDIKKEDELNAVKIAIEELIEDVTPTDKISTPKIVDDDLLSFYPLPDLHFGLLVDKNEMNHTHNYDLKIAEKWVKSSMKYLVDSSPKSKYAIITDLGDFLHASDNDNRTKSGHALDSDGRHSKIIKVAFETMKFLIEKALEKHEIVYFYSVPGNHSEYSGLYSKAFLSAYFKDEPRVIITGNHSSQQYHHYGKNILGFSHGHELRPEKSPEVLVYDNQEIFSETRHRHFHFGHFHNNKMFETPLCKVEIHKNIPPRDAWAEGMGFRGEIGEAKCITYHKEFGEIGRNTFKIQMLE